MEEEYINHCLKKVQLKLGWEPIEKWTDISFRKLSKYIASETGISISALTLKRVSGKVKYKGEYKPQEATKTALARFIGYHSWQHFIDEEKDNIKKTNTNTGISSKKSNPKKTNRYLNKLRYTLLAIVVIILVIFGLINRSNKIQFKCLNPVGPVPHTVTFIYKIPQLKLGGVSLNYGFAHPVLETTETTLAKSDSVYKHTYQIPGVFYPKIISGKRTIDSTLVVIQSGGWVSFFQEEHDNKRTWLDNMFENSYENGNLTLSRKRIAQNGRDTIGVYYTLHRKIDRFDVEGDNFSCYARIKNAAKNGGITCFDCNLNFYFEKDVFKIRLVDNNCEGYAQLKIGDLDLNGSKDNLTNITVSLADWVNFHLEVHEKNIKIRYDDKEVFTGSYSTETGRLLGLGFRFKGSGLVDELELFDKDNHRVYFEDFE